MSQITIEKAIISDAKRLAEIEKRAFDVELQKWVMQPNVEIDNNLKPPGYATTKMTNYMIIELDYFKVLNQGEIIGGIIVTISGTSYGRIDRIFIDPAFHGQGTGTAVMKLIEKQYPNVRIWHLETSSKLLKNHHFYEKLGYELTYKTDNEYGYQNKIDAAKKIEKLVENKNSSSIQYENCNMAKSEFYDMNLEASSFCNSNLENSHISNCNMSHTRFQNLNLQNSLFGDLNLTKSRLKFVTLSGVQFIDTVLGKEGESITFDGCDLTGSKLSQCNLNNVEIENCDLTGMKINNIAVEDLLNAYYRTSK